MIERGSGERPQITSFAELCCAPGDVVPSREESHNWANEAYHMHSLCICHFLQDFSSFDFFEALWRSSHANNGLVHQRSPPSKLIGAVQRKPALL